MFRKCTGMICAMLLLLALFTLPAAPGPAAADAGYSLVWA